MNDLINHLTQDIENFAGDFTHVESVLYRQGNLIRRSRTGVETIIPLGIGIETDPTVPDHVKAITTNNISNWNTAYSWGNHATAGYLSFIPTLAQVTTAGNTTTNAITVGGLTVAINLIYTDTVNSRVGIGTTIPAYNLHTVGTIAVGTANSLNGTLRVERSGGNTGLILRGSDGNIIGAGFAPVYEPYNYATADHNFNIGHGTAGNFNWFVGNNATLNSNTHLMRLTRGGNLLIGTTTDIGYKLDVAGTTRVQGTTTITPAANTSAIVSTGYSVTGSGTTPLIDLSGTWNTTGIINALRINITNTASSTASNLISLQVGGNTLFRVNASSIAGISTGGPIAANGYGLGNGSAGIFTADGTGAFISTGSSIKFSDGLTDVGYSYIFESGQYVNKTFTSGIGGFISVKRNFAPTSGTGQLNILHLQNTINQTGGANGVTRGLYIQPTLTAAADWRAIESTNGRWVLTDTYSAGSGSLANPTLDISTTWNTTGTPTLIKANVTATATGGLNNVRLIDLQIGGASHFSVNGFGAVVAPLSFSASTTTSFRNITFGGTASENTYSASSNIQPTAGTRNIYFSSISFTPTSGTATLTNFIVAGSINQTGGANGITRGLYVNPTLTAAADWRSIEWTNNTGWGLYGVGTVKNYINGNLLLGTTTDVGFKLDVNGVTRLNGNLVIGALSNIPSSTVDILTGSTNAGIDSGLRLRHSGTDGNTMTLNFGVNTTGAGGDNQGHAYIQAAYWGGGFNTPIFMNPKSDVGLVINYDSYTAAVRNGTAITAGGSIIIKPSSNTNGGYFKGFGFSAANYSPYFGGISAGMVAQFAQTGWQNGIDLVFVTVSGTDVTNNDGLERLRIKNTGEVSINNLSGAGARMVVTDAVGTLSAQAIPASVTINNNNDYRVVTGSATANTLNANAKLVFYDFMGTMYLESEQSWGYGAGLEFVNSNINGTQWGFYAGSTNDTGFMLYRYLPTQVELAYWNTTRYSVRSDVMMGWSATLLSFNAMDTALARESAGVVQINNGTVGSYASLKLLNITATGLAGTGTRMVVADANGLLSTQAIPSGGGGGVTSVGITIGTSGTDVNVSNSPITSSGNITLNIPSASETARGLITTANQVFAGKKTFKASSLVVDTMNTSALIEGKVNGVDHGYIYFGQYFQFTATASAISGFLWKIGDGTNAMELLQDGKLRFNKYGVNTFSGIPATSLGVDANGYLVEYTPVVQAENLTTMERTSLPGAQNGLIVFDINMNKLYVKVPAGWEMIQSMP